MKKKIRISQDLIDTTTINNDSVKQDRSPIIPQRSKLKGELHIIERPDLTPKQKEFISLVLDKKTKMIFLSGPAGTTKSWLSIYCALKLLNEKRVSDLIYLRSVVECSSNSMGYLPGDIDLKISVYLQVLIDKLHELLPNSDIEYLKKEDRIHGEPINYLRGINWNAKCIILDEAQNLNDKELLTVITRVGQFSKIIIVGDPMQSDIRNSGFTKMMSLFNDEESKDHGIYTFQFEDCDCLRSELCKFILTRLKNEI